MRAILKYTVIRLALFVIPFLLIMALGLDPLTAGVAALLIAAASSYLFFYDDKIAMNAALEGMRGKAPEGAPKRDADESAEDALLEPQPADLDVRVVEPGDAAPEGDAGGDAEHERSDTGE